MSEDTGAVEPAIHELRNAVPPARFHVRKIREEGGLSGRQLERLDVIERALARCAAVADDLAALFE